MTATTRLHDKHVWRRLKALADKTRGIVAVAYFGQGGAAQLPLRKGSTLVVNLSMQTVKAGITDPREILKLLNSEVRVHTVENLHAKVYVFGETALIGSPNVSRYSADHLVEVALETRLPAQVAACRAFVLRQIGDEVTKERAEAFVPHWRPPRHPAASAPKKKGVVQPHHRRTWVVHVWDEGYDEDDERNAKKGRPIARERRKKRDALVEFVYAGGRFARDVERDDVVVDVDHEGRHATVLPAAHVLHVQRYWSGKQSRVAVYLAVPKNQEPVSLSLVRKRLGADATVMSDRESSSRLVTSARTVHAILNAIARGPAA